jgi:hypothetical protein
MLELLGNIKKSVMDRPDGALTLGRRFRLWNGLVKRFPTDAQLRHAVLGYVVCGQTASAWENLSLGPTDRRLYNQFRRLCWGSLQEEKGVRAIYHNK